MYGASLLTFNLPLLSVKNIVAEFYRIHLFVFIGQPEMLPMEFVTAKDVKLRLQ